MTVKGDGDSITEYLFNRYGKTMLSAAYKITGNIQDAEDAVQEAFIRISSNIGRINIKDEIRAKNYVVIAAKNSAKDQIRKKLARPTTYDIDDYFDLSCDDFALEIIEKLSVEEIVSVIKSLDEKYRYALYYSIVEDMTDKETSEILGQKLSTTKTQRRRGKAKVIKMLRERESSSNGKQ